MIENNCMLLQTCLQMVASSLAHILCQTTNSCNIEIRTKNEILTIGNHNNNIGYCVIIFIFFSHHHKFIIIQLLQTIYYQC